MSRIREEVRRASAATTVLVAAAVLVGSCSREGGAAEAPKRSAGAVIHLGYQKIGPPFLLKERSQALDAHLAALGVHAEWIEFQSGPPILEAMAAGAVDIGYVGETPPVFAQAGGVPFVYVAADPPSPRAEAILVPNGSPIQSVADLRGKRVALNRGSNVHYLLARALESASLTFTDVDVVFLAPADGRTAFESGKVDAWVIWDPFLADAEIAGARILRDGEGLVPNRFFYLARRELAEKQPDLVRTVLAEYHALGEWESAHAEDSARLLEKSSRIKYEPLLVAERRHVYGIGSITREILAGQQTIADTFARLEVIPRAIRVEDSFLAQASYLPRP